MSELTWRPIAEYDAMKRKPKWCVFRFAKVPHKRGSEYDLPELIETNKCMGCRYPTHFLVLPPLPIQEPQ